MPARWSPREHWARAVRAFCACALVASAASAWSMGPDPSASDASASDDSVRLQIASNIERAYRAGTEVGIDLQISLRDPDRRVGQGVLFLNVVEIDEEKTYPQAMHVVFERATVGEEIFQVVWDGASLRTGLSTRVDVRVRARAPAGEYAIVIQAFRGTETHPHRLRIEDRVAMEAFRFRVVR